MIVKLPTEHHLEFLSLKGGCGGSSESTLVKMSNCWKSHAAAHFEMTYLVQCTFPDTVIISPSIADSSDDFPEPTGPTIITNFPVK